MKDCLVSFSSKGRGDYNKGLLRLIDSAKEHWKGDILCYSPDHPLTEYKGVKINKGLPEPKNIRSYPHAEMPYQFKFALIQEAVEKGYDRIVWLDTTMIINKDLTPLFGNYGISVFHNLGHPLNKYISDHACSLLGVNDEIILNMDQIWGGALLFDFTVRNCFTVFQELKKFSVNGSFKDGGSKRPGFVAHRHDQAVMSVLMNGKCDLYPYGKIAAYEHYLNKEYGDDIYLIYKAI